MEVYLSVWNSFAVNAEDGFQIRLSSDFNNRDRYAGRVEVFFAGEWGRICATGWDVRDANVVCNQLGYRSAINAVQGTVFGISLGPIFLSNVDCRGDEKTISDCIGDGIGTYDQNCDHTTDAGVQCVGRKYQIICRLKGTIHALFILHQLYIYIYG